MWNIGGWEFHWKIKLLSVLIMTKQWLSRIYHMTQIRLHMQSPDYSFQEWSLGNRKKDAKLWHISLLRGISQVHCVQRAFSFASFPEEGKPTQSWAIKISCLFCMRSWSFSLALCLSLKLKAWIVAVVIAFVFHVRVVSTDVLRCCGDDQTLWQMVGIWGRRCIDCNFDSVPTDHLISSQLSYLLPLMLLCISLISFVLFAYLYAEFSVAFDYAVLWIFLQLRGIGSRSWKGLPVLWRWT